MKIFAVLSLLALSLVQEGSCTHLETCDCHEIRDLVNTTVQQAAARLEYKLSVIINSLAYKINTTDQGLSNLLQEGAYTHMNTCDCHEIRDIINSKKSKINDQDFSNLEKSLTSTMEKLIQPIQRQLDYHLPPPPPVKNSEDNPATSCKDLYIHYPNAPSDYYWICTSGSPVRVYCSMNMTCGNQEGGWMKVADIDMTNTSQQCPSGMNLISSPKRLCDITSNGCASNNFIVHGVEYSHMCGRIIAYQKRYPIAFYYHSRGIDGAYVYGVSLTHGQTQRKHIWTFAGASDETTSNPSFKCPCINTNISPPPTTPSYIGNDYFCDTALSTHYSSHRGLQLADPLWDGKGCGNSNTCCSFPGSGVTPPWFVKDLPYSTTDNIEMRLCQPDSSGTTPIEIVELYVQ